TSAAQRPASSAALTTTNGMVLPNLRCRAREKAQPSMPGIRISSRITPGVPWRSRSSSASPPSRARHTLQPASSITCASSSRRSSSSSTRSTDGRVMVHLLCWNRRMGEGQPEGAALALLTFESDPPAHLLHQGAGDIEADPQSAGVLIQAGMGPLVELEDPLLPIGGDAHPPIPDLQSHLLPVHPQADLHVSAGGGVFDGVVDEVGHDVLETP